MNKLNRLVLGAAALALGSASALAADTIDDATLTARVKAALIADPDAKARQIDVESKDGIVQLNGFVDTGAGRAEAERVASGVDGVRSVDNNLEVSGGQRAAGVVVDDAALTGKVKAALLADPAVKSLDINVETREGTVQLNGFVNSPDAREQAAKAARSVAGVKAVQNNLVVKP